MTIQEYSDIIGVDLIILRYANQDGRVIAKFEHCETLNGGILTSDYGTGKTPSEAIRDYIDRINGKKIIINAGLFDKRREYNVPKNLEY